MSQLGQDLSGYSMVKRGKNFSENRNFQNTLVSEKEYELTTIWKKPLITNYRLSERIFGKCKIIHNQTIALTKVVFHFHSINA